MKKLITAVLVLVMSMSLFAGCGSDGGAENESVKVGILQLMEHPSLNTIRESIIEGLEEAGYVDGENMLIDYQNGQNDMTIMKTAAQTFVANGCDVIIAIATPAAQAALSETTEIPIVFAAVTDPVDAGLVDSLEQPGGNVTGTSDEVSAEMIMNLAEEITPGFKTIGALYSSGEDNSASVIAGLKEYADAKGLKVVESAVTNSSEVQQAAQYLVGEHDFKSFCAANAQSQTSVRTIYRCEVTRENDIITISVTGNGFLYNMVRIIAGTLIKVGCGELEPEAIRDILAACDRGAAGPTAPAHGLTMIGLEYER